MMMKHHEHSGFRHVHGRIQKTLYQELVKLHHVFLEHTDLRLTGGSLRADALQTPADCISGEDMVELWEGRFFPDVSTTV